MLQRAIDSSPHSPITDAVPAGAPLVRLTGVAKDYNGFQAVHPLDMTIERGDFVSILGPSGCGKTTLLRMLGGFITPSQGRIEVDGVDVTALPPDKRATNMVFQGYGLFPHMSVRQNIGYGLRLARTPGREVAERVEEMVDLVQLGAFAERAPTALSGGQQQRVALARALIMRPKVLLLDEPFAALDLKLRKAMQDEMRRLHDAIGGTFVFVTHDQTEAMALANRIAVMEGGHLRQLGTAEEIYLRPANHFVSAFVGEANFVRATRRNGRVVLSNGLMVVSPGEDGEVEIGVRPERLMIGAPAEGADVCLRGSVTERLFLGAHVQYRVRTESGETLVANALEGHFSPGDSLRIGWNLADQWVVAS